MTEFPQVLAGRYEIRDLIGRGGMAEVHLGYDKRLSRIIAIKLLRSDIAGDPTFQARFRREAQSAAALNHPTIVAVYDSGEEEFTAPVEVSMMFPGLMSRCTMPARWEYSRASSTPVVISTASGIGTASPSPRSSRTVCPSTYSITM